MMSDDNNVPEDEDVPDEFGDVDVDDAVDAEDPDSPDP